MDIKVIKDDKTNFTHRDVINYEVNMNGDPSIDITIRGGEQKNINLSGIHKVLVIKPYCIWQQDIGFSQVKK